MRGQVDAILDCVAWCGNDGTQDFVEQPLFSSGRLGCRVAWRINAVRLDVPGEYTEHQEAEQKHGKTDTDRQSFHRAPGIPAILDQEQHAAGKAGDDGKQG